MTYLNFASPVENTGIVCLHLRVSSLEIITEEILQRKHGFNSLLPTIDFSYFRCHNTYIWVGWGYTKTFMKILGAPGGL